MKYKYPASMVMMGIKLLKTLIVVDIWTRVTGKKEVLQKKVPPNTILISKSAWNNGAAYSGGAVKDALLKAR